MGIDAIDFGQLYREHLAAAGRSGKTAAQWDARAAKAKDALAHSDYVEAFLARMDLSDCRSVLDVGCGSGALALPLAQRLERVVALDFSAGMLGALRENAKARGIGNIDARLCAWEDDWRDVPVCDIAIASRSTQVADLAAALVRLNAKAAKRVYLTQRVGNQRLDARIPQLLGRNPVGAPDYIYAINILHAMGIHPRLDYIQSGEPEPVRDFGQLLRLVNWSLGELDEEESRRLRSWFDQIADTDPVLLPARRWAFIGWDVAG